MSTLSVSTIKSLTTTTPPVVQDSAGTEIGTFCRAWVNFNGTGVVAINADFNVFSITDNGTGNYTINIDVDLPDGNFAAVGLGQETNTTDTANGTANLQIRRATDSFAAGACRVSTSSDFTAVCVAIFR